jgi:murein DD-endopeptidase MepM/ murein hydrolase activator NlpD
MKNVLTFLLIASFFGSSCSSTSKNIFSKKTPHEKYADKLDEIGLEETPAGRQWLAASRQALENTQEIQLPYKQNGFFGDDKARALGLQFSAKRGTQLNFTITKKGKIPFVLYADVFMRKGSENLPIHAADTATNIFSIAADDDGPYVLRLQPELFRGGEYSLSITVGPSLLFPVAGNKAKTGSFWGASRDGGKRSHEGVDIFAPKYTPVIASSDGYVTGVRDGGIGGKVVWLRVKDRKITLYYAHLEKQLVEEGQEVRKGDTLGLVGNTGNAKYTPSHLHFGVYTSGGPVDPFPFVNPAIKTAEAVPAKNLQNYVKLVKTQKIGSDNRAAKASTLLVPVAVNAKGYITEVPGGGLIQVPFNAVQPTNQGIMSAEVWVGKSVKNSRGKRIM